MIILFYNDDCMLYNMQYCKVTILNFLTLTKGATLNYKMHNYKGTFQIPKGKGKDIPGGPWRPIGLREVNAPTLLRQTANRWRQGCQPYAPVVLYPQVFLIF
jgi:hypothetical protein